MKNIEKILLIVPFVLVMFCRCTDGFPDYVGTDVEILNFSYRTEQLKANGYDVRFSFTVDIPDGVVEKIDEAGFIINGEKKVVSKGISTADLKPAANGCYAIELVLENLEYNKNYPLQVSYFYSSRDAFVNIVSETRDISIYQDKIYSGEFTPVPGHPKEIGYTYAILPMSLKKIDECIAEVGVEYSLYCYSEDYDTPLNYTNYSKLVQRRQSISVDDLKSTNIEFKVSGVDVGRSFSYRFYVKSVSGAMVYSSYQVLDMPAVPTSIAVDLGLSVKWAPMDIGGTLDGSGSPFVCILGYKSYGASYCDYASKFWGADWRTPTKAEAEELCELCKWESTDTGYRVTGPNGNSIIVPRTIVTQTYYDHYNYHWHAIVDGVMSGVHPDHMIYSIRGVCK